MAVVAQPENSPSVGLYQTDTIEKEKSHQEMENAETNAELSNTPVSNEDPDAGKLNKEVIMAYIVT